MAGSASNGSASPTHSEPGAAPVARRDFLTTTGKLSGALASGMLLGASAESLAAMRPAAPSTDLILMDGAEL